jgi:hypothetical protein
VTRPKPAHFLRLQRSSLFCPRAVCVNSAPPVHRAGCGNGAWFDTKAPAIERAGNSYANLNHRATPRLYGFWGALLCEGEPPGEPNYDVCYYCPENGLFASIQEKRLSGIFALLNKLVE